jgi:hypothetical protein
MHSPDHSVVVTTAARTPGEDRRIRTRRYLITQGIRVACVLLAVLLPVEPIWKIGFIAGSVVLPWFGVVAANAGPSLERGRDSAVVLSPVAMPEAPALGPGRVIDADR